AMRERESAPRELVVTTEIEVTGYVKVSIKDTGIGLDPATADKLFTPFYTTKSNGMGMGLSVSRTIIENHRGRLWAESNRGPGSTFHFLVPSQLASQSAELTMHFPMADSVNAIGNS
ncbi:ATP-binding protein, partial [Xanthomonas sontii]|uniref:ATP-binding protein n=1 Tax=Xanthomonas sontii TaxID=2650745 RepID=UPI0027F0CE3F